MYTVVPYRCSLHSQACGYQRALPVGAHFLPPSRTGELLTGHGSSGAGWLMGERRETRSLSWEFRENTPLDCLVCDFVNKLMAPVWHNGLLISRPGLDSGEGQAGRRAHSAPGRKATHGGCPEMCLPGLGTPSDCYGTLTGATVLQCSTTTPL